MAWHRGNYACILVLSVLRSRNKDLRSLRYIFCIRSLEHLFILMQLHLYAMTGFDCCKLVQNYA